MQRVVSGVILGAVALALIWFLTSIALLGVALIVVAMAFHEYDRIVDKIGAKVPFWTTLVATLGLLPAALSNGIGAQTQKPLAIVVIGWSAGIRT